MAEGGPPEYTVTVPPLKLAVASRFSSLPSGLKATPSGASPVGYGLPVTWLTAPVGDTANTDAVESLKFATASRLPPALKASWSGPAPASNGEPATGVTAPVDWSSSNIDTWLASWSAVAKSTLPPTTGLKAPK